MTFPRGALPLGSRSGGDMPAIRFVALALAALSVASCSSDIGTKRVGGTVVVAAAGRQIGDAPSVFAGSRVAGVAATPGAFLGNGVGAALDNEDKSRAYAAQMRALETGPSGAPVAWRNPDSGHYGNVVPGPAYQVNGLPCRHYTHTVYIDGKPQIARGTACRDTDSTWTIAR
jgi:surface antigen